MLDAEEREGSSRGRLDLLLEQLGPNVVSETLEVELGALGRFQSGVELSRIRYNSQKKRSKRG